MSMQEAIKHAAAAASRVVAGVRHDQLDDPTPCSEFDVRALGNHMTGFLPYSANAARKGPALEGEAPDFTAHDWAGTYATMADDLAAAWGEEGAMDGEVPFGSGIMPSAGAANITLMELTVHAWDLAKATGQPYSLDPTTEKMAAAIASQAGPNGREGGFFGPEVAIDDDAGDWQKALGAVGRDPNWAP